jgi:hypothetical protein
MDDDTKRAFDLLQAAKASMGFGNLESTVRGFMGIASDIVAVRSELESYKNGESVRIESAVSKAIIANEAVWQTRVESANKTITDLRTQNEQLLVGQAVNMSYSTLFSIAWKKFWALRKKT